MELNNLRITTSSDNLSIDSLKQRSNDLPHVHKPCVSETNNCILDNLKRCTSLNSYLYECKIVVKRPNSQIVQHQFLPKPLVQISNVNAESETESEPEPESSPRTGSSLPIPADTWLIGGALGSRNSSLVFRSSALAGTTKEQIRNKPAWKLHVTYKVMQAETKLLAKLLDCHGVTEVPNECNDFNLLWTGNHPKPGLFRAMNQHQRINHFPRSYELTRKDRLYKNIERMQHSKGLRNFDFIPQTFIMPGDFKQLCSVHYRLRGPWIVKPVASSRGRGIFIVETPYQVPLDEPVVVAKYIARPLLVNGHKCDLRLYVAVTSYDPLLIYIYEEGLVRFATVKYDTSHKQLWNPCMHLCNYSINKYHSDYIKSDDPCAENVGHKWTLSALLRYLKSQGKDTVQLMAQIEDIVVKAIITSANTIVTACQMFVPHTGNCFELFGFDILIDDELKPWLLEVNLSPSLGCDSPLDVRLKSAMLADLLTLIGLPAVDPILKSVRNHTTSTTPTTTNRNNVLKMKLAACRRVHSADGLSETTSRKSTSTFCLSAEENRIVKFARTQFERRGGWVRVFPTADCWAKYSQYLDSTTGIPTSALSSTSTNATTTSSCYSGVQHNYNQLLHMQLFPNAPRSRKYGATMNVVMNAKNNTTVGGSDVIKDVVGQRHNRYQRQLNRGHKTNLFPSPNNAIGTTKSHWDEVKLSICNMLKEGKLLTQEEARRTFSQYLGCILRRITTINTTDTEQQESHIEIVLKFLLKASAYLRTPFIVKVPNSKLTCKDRAAIVAKQLNDFLYLYNRETDLYMDHVDRLNSIPNKLYKEFLESAKENDLEEILTLHTIKNLPAQQQQQQHQHHPITNTNCGFQGLLKCFPNVTATNMKTTSSTIIKRTALKVTKPF